MESWTVPAKRPRGHTDGAIVPHTAAAAAASSSNGQHDSLLIQTAKLALQLAATQRDHSAALQRCILVNADCSVIAPMQATLKRYHDERATSHGKCTLLGAPHHHLWASMVLSLIACPGMAGNIVTALRSHADKISDPQQLEDVVHTCRLARTFNGGFRIILSVAHELQDVLHTILSAFAQLGASIKHGAPPPSSTERSIARAVRGLNNSSSGD